MDFLFVYGVFLFIVVWFCGFFGCLFWFGFFEDESSLSNKTRAGASVQIMIRQCRVLWAWV